MDAISFLTPPSKPGPGFGPRDSVTAPDDSAFETAMAEASRAPEPRPEKEPLRKANAPAEDSPEASETDPQTVPVVAPVNTAAVNVALEASAKGLQPGAADPALLGEIAGAAGKGDPVVPMPDVAADPALPGQSQGAAGLALEASAGDPAQAALAQLAPQGGKKAGAPAAEADQKSPSPAAAAGPGAQSDASKDSVKAANGAQNGGGEGAQGKSSNGAAKGAAPEGASAGVSNTAAGGNDGAFTATLEHVRAATAEASAANAQHASAQRAPPAHQIAQQIVRRMTGGGATFDLRLDPPEFGKVSVQLEVGADNKVSAMISADNPSALAELVRSARELERALNQAGFQLNERGLTFDLSDKGTQFADREGRSRPGAGGRVEETIEPETPALIRASPWRAARVDLIA